MNAFVLSNMPFMKVPVDYAQGHQLQILIKQIVSVIHLLKFSFKIEDYVKNVQLIHHQIAKEQNAFVIVVISKKMVHVFKTVPLILKFEMENVLVLKITIMIMENVNKRLNALRILLGTRES